MQDGQHAAIAGGIQELVAVPACGERTGFGFTVADDAGDDQVGVVEGRTERVGERVAKLAALVDRSGVLGATLDPPGKLELLEEAVQSLLVPLMSGRPRVGPRGRRARRAPGRRVPGP
jgi:hypothetical protein